MGAACAGREKTCGIGEAMRAALLTALDAGSSSGEKDALWKAIARHVSERKTWLERGVRAGERRGEESTG